MGPVLGLRVGHDNVRCDRAMPFPVNEAPDSPATAARLNVCRLPVPFLAVLASSSARHLHVRANNAAACVSSLTIQRVQPYVLGQGEHEREQRHYLDLDRHLRFLGDRTRRA